MKLSEKLGFMFICILTVFQMILYVKKEPEAIEVISTGVAKESVFFTEIDQELNSFENIKVLSLIENSYGNWNGRINISGNKEDIINTIKNLDGYSIENYLITGDNEFLEVILDIYR